MSGRVLNIIDLTAGYAGAPAVRGLNMYTDAGELVALLGPNGAGKTTTLRVISGLLRPMGGSVTYEKSDVSQMSPTNLARAGVVHVPESRGIFHSLTVAQHFRLGWRKQRLDLAQALNYFPALAELTDRRAGLLSGGEQQMLAIARALARRPKLLLLDELSLGLAPVIVERVLPIIRRFATDSGAAVILVEQHVELALELADRAYVLSHGECTIDGPAEKLRHDHGILLSSYLGDTEDGPSRAQTTVADTDGEVAGPE